MAEMTRQEHLEWAKKRAHEYVEAGDLEGALTSLISDLQKHDETRGHLGCELGFSLFMGGHLSTAGTMRKFIEDFN